MTAETDLLPLPEPTDVMVIRGTARRGFTAEQVTDYARANVAHHVAAQADEIEALRAALESLRAHMGNAVRNRDGIIKALEEVRDEQGAAIHRLRAELEIAKGQAEFYRTARNAQQRKAERLAEALREWYRQATDKYGGARIQAPGHCHGKIGIWDDDNGKYAGADCAQCALWFIAAELEGPPTRAALDDQEGPTREAASA